MQIIFFYFLFYCSINGEVLEHDATPIELELEEEEVIDLTLKK